jgi:hypothetical protein
MYIHLEQGSPPPPTVQKEMTDCYSKLTDVHSLLRSGPGSVCFQICIVVTNNFHLDLLDKNLVFLGLAQLTISHLAQQASYI